MPYAPTAVIAHQSRTDSVPGARNEAAFYHEGPCERSGTSSRSPPGPSGRQSGRFARRSGLTARPAHNWARKPTTVPPRASLLARALEEWPPDLLAIRAEDTDFGGHEVFGRSAANDTATIRRAWTGLALLYPPDKGGRPEPRLPINASYVQAQHAVPDGLPPHG